MNLMRSRFETTQDIYITLENNKMNFKVVGSNTLENHNNINSPKNKLYFHL